MIFKIGSCEDDNCHECDQYVETEALFSTVLYSCKLSNNRELFDPWITPYWCKLKKEEANG